MADAAEVGADEQLTVLGAARRVAPDRPCLLARRLWLAVPIAVCGGAVGGKGASDHHGRTIAAPMPAGLAGLHHSPTFIRSVRRRFRFFSGAQARVVSRIL